MVRSIASTLAQNLVGNAEIERKYGAMVTILKEILGVVPNSFSYMELWPPMGKNFTALFSNFLNMPWMMMGLSAPQDVIGLVIYATSNASKCDYCMAHCCAFALRRGTSVETITMQSSRTPAQEAAVVMAESLVSIPSTYSEIVKKDLVEHYGEANAEWLVMAAVFMGFLNKFMDCTGVELEPLCRSEVLEVLAPTTWVDRWDTGKQLETPVAPRSDSIWTLLRILPAVLSIMNTEIALMRGIPSSADEGRIYLQEHTHWDEPVISHMQHNSARRAHILVLRDSLDVELSELGIADKALAGVAFAATIHNDALRARCAALAVYYGVENDIIETVADGGVHGLDDTRKSAVNLGRSFASSPPITDSDDVHDAANALSSKQLVEMVSWVALLQLVHRLTVWYEL